MVNKKIKILLSLAVFLVSVSASYYPIHSKGYALWGDNLNLIEARNDALAGTYSFQSADGVILSSDHANQAVVTAVTNPLTPIIYSQIFKTFGFRPLLPIYIAMVLFGIFNVIIFLILSRLFSLFAGFIAGIISALVPAMVVESMMGGTYEWAMLFFGLALWSYFSSGELFRPSRTRLVLASVFFALAALARNAFAISFIPFILYDFWLCRDWKRSLIFLTPFLLIFGLTLTQFSWLPLPNGYLSTDNQPFQLIGHVFNDPYSYYYNHDATLNGILQNPSGLRRTDVEFLTHWGYKISLNQRLRAYSDAAVFYLETLFSMTELGGPLIWLLIITGAFALWKKEKRIVIFSGLWLAVWFGALVAMKTSNDDHIAELIFPYVLLAAVGFLELIKNSHRTKWILPLAILFLAGHLAFADHWRLSIDYHSSKAGTVKDLIPSTPRTSGVIAMGVHPDAVAEFAYLTNQDVVYFHPDTVQTLISQKKLSSAFQIYHVVEATGYDDSLSSGIKNQTGLPVTPLP